MIRDAIAASNEAYAAQQYLNEALQRSVEIMTPASYVIAAIGKKGKKLEDPEALKERLRGFYKDYNPVTDSASSAAGSSSSRSREKRSTNSNARVSSANTELS